MSISRSIVQAVRSLDPPGRFLDKDTVTGLWHDIGHKKAVEKTSQALRDGAAILRKQLSADLGDPNFLNAVFNDDMDKKIDGNEGDTKKREKIVLNASGKENNSKESKGNSVEKIKVVKAKTTQGKKGHRGVNSNPSALAIATIKAKNKRRYKTPDEPRTPGPDYRWNYHQCPPSPRSPLPPPPHARSLPSSPVTWGGGPPKYPERHGSYSHHHSIYNHPPPSPYKHSEHGSHTRGRSYDHYHSISGHDSRMHPRYHSWSSHGSSPHSARHHHNLSHQRYHHHQPPMYRPQSPGHPRSPTPPPVPPLSSGPLPPGRHTYSPSDFYSQPPLPEPREPWSPRRGYRHQYETYNSPQPHYSPHHGDYRPERSPSWTPRSRSPNHHGHYYDPDYPGNSESRGGLAVPHLGGEGRQNKIRFSSKLHLTRRSNNPMIREPDIPPRPPNYSPKDFRPPSPVSPRYQRSNDESSYFNCSTVKEEKKTSDLDKIVRSQESSETRLTFSSSRLQPIKTESRSSPDQEDIERENTVARIKKDDESESRTSPAGFLQFNNNEIKHVERVEDDVSEEAPGVDDIAMSPIPYHREDPVTLMDLPDDILALPIEPYGPHDDPALS